MSDYEARTREIHMAIKATLLSYLDPLIDEPSPDLLEQLACVQTAAMAAAVEIYMATRNRAVPLKDLRRGLIGGIDHFMKEALKDECAGSA